MDIDDQGTPQSEGHGLQEPLDDARQRVEELEAVGVVARGAIPGFDAALEAARSRLEHLQRLRKASRPVHWRLVEARRRARIKADALEKARADSARIHREYEVVQARLAAQEAEVATAMEALSEADRAVAAVVNEIAGEATMGCGGAAADALAVAEGLVTQVGALSGALGSDNVESGVAAIQAQLAALLRELRGSRIAAEPPPVVLVPDERLQEDGYEGGDGCRAGAAEPSMVPAVDQGRARGRHLPAPVSGRHGTSPARSHTRSRSRDSAASAGSDGEAVALRRAAQAPGQRTLHDWAVQPAASRG